MKKIVILAELVLMKLFFSLHCFAAIPGWPYVKVDNETLTFCFGTPTLTRPGNESPINIKSEYTEEPEWVKNYGKQIKKVIIEPSFTHYKPTSTAYWFCNLSSLESVEGLEYLKTEEVIDMRNMFNGCTSLKELDLSGFNTSKVNYMDRMFQNCRNLQTIYGGDGWDTSQLLILMGYSSAGYMFYKCEKIRGGKGTTYTAASRGLDFVFAHVDGGKANPGYFTEKGGAKEAYTTYEKGILTFYYDNQKESRTEQVYTLEDWYASPVHYREINGVDITDKLPEWHNNKGELVKVVFDSSFADYYPTSTANWFYECEAIENIVNIGSLNTSRVTDMGSMFDGCKALASLDLSCFVTDKVITMDQMFADCSSLTSLDLSSFNTSRVIWMQGMFGGCSRLTELIINHLNTENVIYMQNMFRGCTNLQTIDVSSFVTSKVENMEAMFFNCRNLAQLDLSFFDTQNVKNMGKMFGFCVQIPELNLNNFNTSNVENMAQMFMFCQKLSNLNISKFKTSKVTNMAYMFSNCWALKEIDLDTFNTSNVINMAQMFGCCLGLKQLNLSGFVTSKVTSMFEMFYMCKNLATLDISKFTTTNVSNMENMFRNCKKLKILNLRSFNTSKVKKMSGMFVDCEVLNTIYVTPIWSIQNVSSGIKVFDGCYELVGGKGTRFDESHTDYDYAIIDEGSQNPGYLTYLVPGQKEAYAVAEDNKLTFYYDTKREIRQGDSYVIKETYTFNRFVGSEDGSNTISWTDMDVPGWCKNKKITNAAFDTSFSYYYPTSTAFWFAFLENLQRIDNISYLNTDYVTSMEKMFTYCKAIPSLDLKTFKTSNVTNMKGLFSFCESLVELNISSFNTTNVTDMSMMFHGCISIPSINLKSFNTKNVTNMSSMFNINKKLKSLDLSSFNTANVTDMSQMFIHCYELKDLNLSSFDTRKVTKMAGMFEGMGLETLDLSSFNTINVEDMDRMFTESEYLRTIYVSNDWTINSLRTGRDMFLACYSLVGGSGTNYNPQLNADPLYAHIDGGTANPGYLTSMASSGVCTILSPQDQQTIWYNLQGSREINPRKGVYIRNGKQLLVR